MNHAYSPHERASNMLAPGSDHFQAAPSVRGILKLLSLGPDDLVLDFSENRALYATTIARFFSDSDGRGVVFTCDPSEAALEEVERKTAQLGASHHFYPVLLDDTIPFQLPFHDEQLDAILTTDRIFPSAGSTPYLREFARILKPCGTLLLAQSTVKTTFRTPKSVTRLPLAADLSPFLKSAGFEILTPFDARNYLWIIRAMKPVISFA